MIDANLVSRLRAGFPNSHPFELAIEDCEILMRAAADRIAALTKTVFNTRRNIANHPTNRHHRRRSAAIRAMKEQP